MKRQLLLLNLFLSFCTLNAQETECDYRPFIEDGKVWVSLCDFIPQLELRGLKLWRPGNQFYSYMIEFNYFDGDTIVADRQCKKWAFHYYSPENDKSVIIHLPAYEEDKKVWFFFDGEKAPLLAYDFGAKVGDSIVVCAPLALYYDEYVGLLYSHDEFVKEYQDTLVIHSRTEEEIGGRMQQVMRYYSPKYDAGYIDIGVFNNYIMDGIGSYWTPEFNQSRQRFPSLAPFLIYCIVGNELLYVDKEKADYYEIAFPKNFAYSNTLRSLTAIHSPYTVNGKSVNSKYYDLSGRRLSTPPAEGIYIRDGKKVIAQ